MLLHPLAAQTIGKDKDQKRVFRKFAASRVSEEGG